MNTYKKLILLCSVLLTGCSFLTPVKKTNSNFVLSKLPTVSTHKTHSLTLLVMPSDIGAVYNTTQIAYSKHPYQISYFAKNHWADTPSKMFQQLTIQSLLNTHYFRAVVSSSAVGNYNYILNIQLLELKQDFTTHPSETHMTVRAQITNVNSNQIIAAKEFHASAVAPQDTPCGGVIAANAASAKILKELSNFTIQHIHP